MAPAWTTVINGTVSSRNGDVSVTLSCALLNSHSGAVVSEKTVTVEADSLDNSDKGVLSSAAGQRLALNGLLDNTQGGSISSGAELTLLTGNLDNSHQGTIGADGTLLVTASEAVDNSTDGLIASRTAGLEVNAASLGNAKGSLQGKGAVNLTVTGDIDNQSGKVIAQDGDLNVTAANLDSRGGTLSSVKGALETHIVGVLKNGYDLNNNGQGGTIQAQRLMLKALGGIDNNGGRIAAQAGDAVLNAGLLGNIDNRNAGIYASNLVQITGHDLDNSGDQGGKVSANQISFDLLGTLNNRQGIIESGSTLSTTAASLDNQNGQLRALGKSLRTVFAIGGLLDNSNGTLETANTDLGLDVGSFQNQGGSVLHVGTGIFGISMANLNDVGGQLVTHGDLTLDGDSWTNSSSLQANHLTVNVNHLTQTATGQLLSTADFNGHGIDWSNDGQIGTDGNAIVDLSGGYGGKGRLSSAGTLDLHAALVRLEETGSIAGGGASTVSVDGTLTSYGRLTSAGDMTVTAAGINNYGTLGSAQTLTATTGALLNDHGLIFSGGDMGLRVDSLSNRYASVYSLGKLSIDRDGQGALASSIVNSSGSIQSDASMSLAASTIQNVRAVLTTNNPGIYTASIAEVQCIEHYNAGDCSGKRNHVWQIIQRDKFEVTEASEASSITAGGTLAIQGGDLLNSSSSIGSGGAFSVNMANLFNNGIETGETETSRTFRSERTNDAGGLYASAASFNTYYSSQGAGYNPNNLGGLLGAMSGFIGQTEAELDQFRSTRKIASSDQSYAAIIQAGGAVSVNTQNGITSSVVRPGYTYVGAGPRTDTQAPANTFSTHITVNQQLPPDLAQQQVNPVSLPGFSLPVGSNGLFRLSGQASTTYQPAVHVPGLPDTSGRSSPQKYLIETNPVLTDLKQFMSSDYLLSNLGYDPDQSAKRLGDGFYEQKLIQQAVTARTGQRFIDGQTSDDGMFKYLMSNAVASKQELNLQLGVSLTSEQVAALTHDIVWMENATVNGEQVLVPVLYLANANNRLAPNGALIQGSDVTLIAGKELNNTGTLRASNNLTATAGSDMVNSGLLEAKNRLEALAGNNLTNKAGGIIAGQDVSVAATTGDVINERTITTHASSSGYRTERTDFVDNAARIEAANGLTVKAGQDVNNTGGVLKSGADTTISAGRDVNLASVEKVTSGVRGLHTDQTISQYGSTVDAGQDLKVSAGRNVTAIASQIAAKRDVNVSAVGDLSLASAADEQHSYGKTKKVTSQEDHVSQVSTTVTAGGNVALSASQDLLVSASRVSAGKEAYLYAGNDLDLNAAQNSDYSYYRKTKTSHSGLSSSQKTRIDSSSSTTQQGASISADTVVVRAGKDIGTIASDIASTNSTSLIAGRNVVIDGATETFKQSHSTSTKKSGLLSSGGIGFTLGSMSNQNTSTSTTETTRASTVGSVLGGVSIEAGKDLTVRASDVVAGKDISLTGQNVSVLASENKNRSEQTSKSKSSGLTLALSGVVGSAVDSAYQTAKQAKSEDDSRLSALQGVKAGLMGIQAWQAAQQESGKTADNAGQFVGISISLGSQRSNSKQTQEQSVSQGSSLTSGNNLTIVAAGNGTPGADGDIRIQGSKLQAGNEMLLAAERDIRLEAAANTQKLDGKNSSSGGAIGVSFGVGSSYAGLSIFANANKGTGSEKGNGTTWTETTLDAGKQVSLISGRDTALKGAQVSADNITANVGRDLTLQSLQDTDDYKSKQTNVSGGARFTFGTMTGSGSLSVNKSKIDSKYESVQEQTGLFSGKSGYQVDVKNHTQLDGSVIASTSDADKNRLSTGTLGWSDIENKAQFKTQMTNASISGGNGGTSGFISNMPSATLIAYNHSGSTSGTTSSAVSNGTLDIRDPAKQQQDVATLSHDVEHANDSISPIFDKEKEQKRLRQVQLIGEIGTQAVDIVRTKGQIDADKEARAELDKRGVKEPGKDASQEDIDRYKQQLIATDAYKRIMEDYGVGGNYPRVAQAVTAALQGLVGGDIGSALAGASAPYLARVIKKTTGDNAALNTMAHAVLGAVVAQAQGNSALSGAAGAATGEYIAHQLYPGIKTADLTQEQKETVVALSGLAAGLAGGIAGGDLSGAVTGAQAGSNAVENNYLSKQQQAQKETELAESKTLVAWAVNSFSYR